MEQQEPARVSSEPVGNQEAADAQTVLQTQQRVGRQIHSIRCLCGCPCLGYIPKEQQQQQELVEGPYPCKGSERATKPTERMQQV